MKHFEKLKYTFIYIAPVMIFLSLYLGGYASFLAVVFIFGFIPIVELLLNGTTQNMDKIEEEMAKQDRFYDYLLYSLVPLQFALLGYFLFRVYDPTLAIYEKVGMTIAFGLSGILSINGAHELGHRNTRHEQLMSKMLLSTALYMHFFIEHNRGHHKNVSTDEDPASSKYGENLYTFYIRSVTGSWLSAWNLERKRLAKTKQNFWSIHNEMLRYQFIQGFMLLSIALLFNWQVLLCFIAAAVIAFSLLETVNYIEHYGLRRKKNGDNYERTLPIHSWNSNHPLGRLILLEVTRHSDHHYLASRKYQILRHFDESPQMPTGYPGMVLLAFIPPLWFKVMHKQIEKYRASAEGTSLA